MKKRITLYLCAITLIVVIVNLLLFKPTVDVLHHPDIVFSPYSDQSVGGSSEFNLDTTLSGGVHFTYKRNKRDGYPFVGLALKKDSGCFSIKDYALHVNAETRGSNTINVRLEVFSPGFSDPLNSRTFVFAQKVIHGETKNRIDKFIALDDLEVPSWWASGVGIHNDEIPVFDFNNTCSIVLDHDPTHPIGEEATIILKELEFVPKQTPLILFNSIIGVVVIVFFGLRFVREKKLVPVAAPYRESEISEPIRKNNEEEVITFLSENYRQPNLKIADIEQATGVAQAEIRAVISDKYGLGIKQYINFLRIEEAKRLLVTSSLQVKEIGYDVGYENLQHFLRVFKASVQLTPSEYRQKTTN